MQAIQANIFEGLFVLDLSSILAGPLTTSFFAECGAKVVKIENKLTNGDATRTWKLPSESVDTPYSAYYASANFRKEVLMLDLTNEKDVQVVKDLIIKADIIVSNFQKKVAERLGLSPDMLLTLNPKAIIAQLSAYTYDDPRPGYDLVMQGETGWLSMNGIDENHLAKLPVAIIDIIAAHQMKEAILMALWYQSKRQNGAIIHVSLYQSALSALANQGTNYLIAGHIPKPLATLHPNIAPYGDIFKSKEGTVFLLAVGSDGQFKKLWETLNLDIHTYHTFESNSNRVKFRSHLIQILSSKFEQMPFDVLESKLTEGNIPFCKIRNLMEVFSVIDANPMLVENVIDNDVLPSIKSTAFTIYQR
jgi:crotonobetainyl-CoA:carnitine CoA-transferase CaiB-like acyl-CoA transferase